MQTAPKPFAFVIMPFSDEFSDVYNISIKDACGNNEIYCERLDEQIFSENILDRIYNQISKADIIVAEMTGRNPNVFYEVGYAHALGKRVILITREESDIPFDLKHHHHIVYGGRLDYLRTELQKRVKWHLEDATSDRPFHIDELEFYINGNPLTENMRLVLTPKFDRHKTANGADGHPIPHSNHVILNLSVHNPARKRFSALDFCLLLFTDDIFFRSGYTVANTEFIYDMIQMPDRRVGHRPSQFFTVEPGGWVSIPFWLFIEKRLNDHIETACTLRILGSGPYIDYNFALELCP